MLIQNSIKIYDCYKNKDIGYLTFDRKNYAKDYYLSNRSRYLNYNQLHKDRLKRLKAIWFQKNKERLRIKWGYKRRNKTKNKNIYPPTSYEVKPIVIDFS